MTNMQTSKQIIGQAIDSLDELLSDTESGVPETVYEQVLDAREALSKVYRLQIGWNMRRNMQRSAKRS